MRLQGGINDWMGAGGPIGESPSQFRNPVVRAQRISSSGKLEFDQSSTDVRGLQQVIRATFAEYRINLARARDTIVRLYDCERRKREALEVVFRNAYLDTHRRSCEERSSRCVLFSLCSIADRDTDAIVSYGLAMLADVALRNAALE